MAWRRTSAGVNNLSDTWYHAWFSPFRRTLCPQPLGVFGDTNLLGFTNSGYRRLARISNGQKMRYY